MDIQFLKGLISIVFSFISGVCLLYFVWIFNFEVLYGSRLPPAGNNPAIYSHPLPPVVSFLFTIHSSFYQKQLGSHKNTHWLIKKRLFFMKNSHSIRKSSLKIHLIQPDSSRCSLLFSTPPTRGSSFLKKRHFLVTTKSETANLLVTSF